MFQLSPEELPVSKITNCDCRHERRRTMNMNPSVLLDIETAPEL